MEMEELPDFLGWSVKRKGKNPTVVLDAICDGELSIWNGHFGSPGSYNYINLLDTSTKTRNICEEICEPSLRYVVNGNYSTII